jgi:hypothetical protein
MSGTCGHRDRQCQRARRGPPTGAPPRMA